MPEIVVTELLTIRNSSSQRSVCLGASTTMITTAIAIVALLLL